MQGGQAVQPVVATSDYALIVRSPYRSQSRTRRLVDELALNVVLDMGYTESTDGAVAWKTAGLQGLTLARRFRKNMPATADDTIEIALTPTATGEYSIRIYGNRATPGGSGVNPDLAALRQQVDTLLQRQTQPSPAAGRDAVARHVYQLSFVQADRAVGILKALGYGTIEFTQAPGDTKYDTVFEPVRKGEVALPVVIKMIDAAKTSLMDPFVNPSPQQPMQQQFQQGGGQRQPIPDIGGTFLHQITTGDAQERLLILYDENDPEALERLVNILQSQIDVPARQVVISALIVEANSNKLRELGITFKGTNSQTTGSFRENPSTGVQLPFTLTYDQLALKTAFSLTATLNALVEKGEAEILSNPSVLVLDGRQARIQIGQQVPVVNSTATAAGITSSVDYFPVGIVLNLRPRISDDGSEVTMQVETIVSAVASTAPVGTGVFFAPTVDNRQVQTFVRVADSTPFIIGGLISSNNNRRRSGIPFLSEIPLLGNLFRSTTVTNDKREVIVVLTPHVVPIEEKSFSYVIPKDSDIFDSFGNKLFRNAYRIRSRDVYDLRFVYESDVFQQMLTRIRALSAAHTAMRQSPKLASVIDGGVPGEDILVRRMLWEIIRKTDFARNLSLERIIFFEPSSGDRASTDFVLSFLKNKLEQVQGRNALALSFEAENPGTVEHPFVQPKADVSYLNVSKATYEQKLIELNPKNAAGAPDRWAILLSKEFSGTAEPLDVLKGVLILKRLLALNTSLPLTIKDFRVGRQIIFPTEEDVEQGFHVIDRDAARLFFEVMQYYRAFEREFNLQTRSILTQIDAMEGTRPAARPPAQ